ncbi:MAG: hypothetical protein QNJ71_06765 [Acidimicrobiia bacterium]|nr:hypothetical protein [Acidimicrobiia bacterium]
MAHESNASTEKSRSQRLTPVDKLIIVLCVVGVVMMTYLVLDASGITLFDGHAAEVISGFWSTEATIGLIVAFVVAIVVGFFIWLLAQATVSNPNDDEIEDTYTQDMVAE